jgi:Mg-chelatase subunit ChlD
MDAETALNRWRLALGRYSESAIGQPADPRFREIAEAMDWLYSREYGKGRDIYGGREASQLSIPSWLDKVSTLFPKKAAEKIEGHALERYGLSELLTDERVLERLEPNMSLLKQILSLKGAMAPNVLDKAREIVRAVVEDLKKRMESDVRRAMLGKKDPSRSSPLKIARNFDFKKTLRKNMKNYDAELGAVAIQKAYFCSNVERYSPWHIVLLVDESGSMLSSVIHAAVMASIFAGLPSLSVRLAIFDTSVVDLSGYIDDPVEALMRVQLGGGTNIAGALRYGESLISFPQRTIVVAVTDLFEGYGYQHMYEAARAILEGGSRLFVLTALDADASPGSFDRTAAKRMASLGASVASLTPDALAEWVASAIKGG